MSLADKIEEIRQKPEEQRVRYVWFMVFISMVFVIFIWFFSFKSNFRNDDRINSGEDMATGLEKDGSIENSQGQGNIDR